MGGGDGGAPLETRVDQVASAIELEEIEARRARRQRLGLFQYISISTLFAVFTLGNVSAITLFFLNGFEVTTLSDTSMASLSAATIAEVAGMLTIIVTRLFTEFGDQEQ